MSFANSSAGEKAVRLPPLIVVDTASVIIGKENNAPPIKNRIAGMRMAVCAGLLTCSIVLKIALTAIKTPDK